MAVDVSPTDPSWHRFTTADPTRSPGANTVTYGADLPSEDDLRLLGDVEGLRILDLGCGSGHNAVVLAAKGAKVIGVDDDAAALDVARGQADDAEVRVELHQGQLHELAFLRSDSVDAAISAMALAAVDDLARVFRQVHRVLKPEAPLVCSLPHPAFAMLDPAGRDPLRIVRPYQQDDPRPWSLGDAEVVDQPRTIGQIFTTLHRASFAVDQLLEPAPDTGGNPGPSSAELATVVPSTLVIRARKLGN